MKDLKYAVMQAIRICLDVQPSERVVVIYDGAASRIAQSIIEESKRITESVRSFLVESYGTRSNDGNNPLKFPEEIKHALENADVSFYIAGNTFPGEFESFRKPMISVVNNNKARHAHMPGINEEVFIKGMAVDYHEVKALTEKIYSIVKDSRQIRVTTSAGSDFTVEFDPKYRWTMANGFPTSETWTNLPDGETFTTPSNLNGRVVVDGVLGDHFDKKYGLLDKNPLILDFQNGRIISVSCSNKILEKDFEEYISRDENSNRVGEFAIGTNIGFEKLLGNMIHDEKFPGVHIAIGDPLGEKTNAEWKSNLHCDMVLRNCNIFVGDSQIMFDGKFSPEIISSVLK